MIQIQKLSKSYGSKILLDSASTTISPGQHIAVIGPNGAGKTTLFKMIMGLEEPDSGVITRSRGLRVGYLPQEARIDSDLSTLEYMLEGAAVPEWDLKKLAAGLGLDQARVSSPLRSLSGGYRMRAALVKLLGTDPEILLLDEPTNYLDLETLLVLEEFLAGFLGTFLLISHDREFLRKVCDHTLEVEGGTLTQFPGTIDDYFEQKALLKEQMQAQALSQEAKRKEILDFVARFGAKATKARQAQSRLKQLDRMEKIEIKRGPARVKLRIPAPEHVGREALRTRSLQLGYGDRTILKDVSLSIARGDRVAIVGLNGAGKSTLLKALAGELAPQSGEITTGLRVERGYYAQHVSEALHPEQTVYQSFMAGTDAQTTPQMVLDLAGSLLFSGDAIQKPVRVLSGGEKSRVALGKVLLSRASVLLLDEPTNHLDFDTVEALSAGLEEHPGTVLVVSHDRAFMSRVATKIIEVNQGQVRVYPGTYDDYVWSLQRGAYQVQAASSKPITVSPVETVSLSENHQNYLLRKEQQAERRQLIKQIEKLERDIAKWETQKAEHHTLLTREPGAWTADLGQKIANVQKQLDECEALWLELHEKLARFEN